jgi:TetR/AcrR family transcriptional regulator, mexJK operon transcriptional repressor
MGRQDAIVTATRAQQTKKEREVLSVASEYFLSHGYKGTSINAMARDSGISKESIYRYFSSKKELFQAVIAKELRDYRKRLDFLNFEFDSISLEAALQQVAESILQAVSGNRVLAFRRVVFHEAVQTPEIGAIYYQTGPQQAYDYLAKVFTAHHSDTDFEPMKLAHYFVAMNLHRLMLARECNVLKAPSRAEIRRHGKEVTADFLQVFFRNH